MSNKLPVEVSGLDKSGSMSVQVIKLPTKNDWIKNLNTLNKKIGKKFKTDKEYGLSINGKTIRFDDVESLTNIMSSFDYKNTPQFTIVNINQCGSGESNGRKIIVRYNNKTYQTIITEELSNFDDQVYDDLLNGIKSHFNVNGKLYEDVGGKPNYIDDWDDLTDLLEEIEIGESMELCFEGQVQPGAKEPSPENDDDEKKVYESNAPPKHQHFGPKKKVSLIFVGQTGVGKTTLLRSINDFINGVPYEKVKTTAKPKSTGLSQTMNTEQFPLSNNEWAVNIIDTPGIGDTSGIKKDEQHMGNIIDFVGAYGDFNAVCILIKRGTSRRTTTMRYIVSELKSHMPKDVQDNFIVIMTRSDVPVPDTDTLAVIEGLGLGECVEKGRIIPVNNGAYEELDLSQYQKGSPIVKIVKARHKQDYMANHTYLQMLLEMAEKMTPYQGNKMKALKEKRDKLKEQVGVLKQTIDSTFDTEKEINEQLAAFKAAKSTEELNKAYESSSSHTEWEPYKLNGKITTYCNVCQRSCHIDCGLSYGDDITQCCCSGSNNYCTKCGCFMGSHCHMGWGQKAKIVCVKNVDEEMKIAHMDAKQKKKAIEKRKRELNAKLKDLEKKRDQCAADIQRKYKELEGIAIIGYNESFESYMKECKKAVEKDDKLTKEQKQQKIGVFENALKQFQLFQDAIKGNIKKAVDYVL